MEPSASAREGEMGTKMKGGGWAEIHWENPPYRSTVYSGSFETSCFLNIWHVWHTHNNAHTQAQTHAQTHTYTDTLINPPGPALTPSAY